MTPPNPAPILDLIEAFRRSKTMFCAVKLGIFDFLQEHPRTSTELAQEISANPDAMSRLCFACVGLGLIEEESGQFRNSGAAGEYLCRSGRSSMVGYILYSNDVLFQMWDNLEDAVREGTHRWNQSFGFSGPLFDSFFPTDDAMRTSSWACMVLACSVRLRSPPRST